MKSKVNQEASAHGADVAASEHRLAEGPGVNYVSPHLGAVTNSQAQVGVVATSSIRAGETLVVYGGVIVDRAHTNRLGQECRAYFYQIAPGLWYGPGSAMDSVGIGERLNHSCEPNAGFSSPVTLVALRDIAAGESVEVDYATFQSDDLDGSSFVCACGSARCRGVVTPQDWKAVSCRAESYATMQPFLQAMIDPNGSEDARVFSSLILPARWKSPWRGDAISPTLVSASVTRSPADGSVRSLQSIEKGEVVFIAGGIARQRGDDRQIDEGLRQYYRTLGSGFLIGPGQADDVGCLESVAAAPIPNLARVLDLFFVATRKIAAGEALTRQ